MSAPTWLLDAIRAAQSMRVPTVPKPTDRHWVQKDKSEASVDRGSAMVVPNVPSVPSGMCVQRDGLESTSAEAGSDSFESNNIAGRQSDSISHESNPLTRIELERERRRNKVLAMLELNPSTSRAFYTDTDSDPDNIVLVIAARHIATFEMLILKDKYDPFHMLDFIDRFGQTTH